VNLVRPGKVTPSGVMQGSLTAGRASSVRGRFRAGRRHVKIRAGCREAAAGHHRGGQQQVDGAAGDSGFDGQVALGLAGLGVVGHVLRSRRFCEKAAVAAIVLGR
jgi:hypothetical protein